MEGIELARILEGRDHAPLVYFVRMGDHVKIGTTINVTERMRALHLPMSAVALVVPGGHDVERAFHEQWAAYRVDTNREWFRIRGSLTGYLRRRPRGRAPEPTQPAAMGAAPVEPGSGPAPPSPDLIRLSEAVSRGLIGPTVGAARALRKRDPEFPAPAVPARVAGQEHLYRPDDIARYQTQRLARYQPRTERGAT